MSNHVSSTLTLLLAFVVIMPLALSSAGQEKEPDGQVEVSVHAASRSDALHEDVDQEEPVSLQEVPDPVRATILHEVLREVDELTLIQIEREREDGTIVYEAEFQYKDRKIELEVTSDGTFLEKEVTRDIEDEKGPTKDD